MNDSPTDQPNPTNTNDNQQAPLSSVVLPLIERPKWYKNKVVLLLFALIIAGGAVLGWMLLNRKNNATPLDQSKTTNATSQQSTISSAPSMVVFSTETVGDVAGGNCAPTSTTLYRAPLAEGSKTAAQELEKQTMVSHYEVYKNKVLTLTLPSCDSTAGPQVWYSQDSGKSYAKLYNGKTGSGVEGEQITSITFSDDGQSALFASLPSFMSTNNTVKEINLKTKKVADLFVVASSGVFLEAYSPSRKQVLYYSGCYNCDGNTSNKLLSRDLAKDTDTAVFEDSTKLGVQTIVKNDFSKILYVSGVQGEDLGASQPFTVEEFDTGTKTFKKLVTAATNITAGYTAEGAPYYTKENSVFSLAGTEPALLFEASKPILDVYYADKDQIIVRSGAYEAWSLGAYVFATKATTAIMSADEDTKVFGVVTN